jgi:hypothetical protein
MPEIIDRRNSFNGGEFSPWTDPRLDLAKYRSACRQLKNFRPSIYGGAFLRPGTLYMGEAATADKLVRLKDFEFSVTETLVLEFSDLKLRFWETGANAGPVESSPGVAYELTTPWEEADLYSLQFAQQNDVVIVTHPDFNPRILSRLSNASWTIEEIPIEWPATLDLNVTATTLTLSHTTGTGRTLTASTAIFNSGHVGSKWIIRHRRTDPQVKLALNALVSTTTSALFVLGEWSCNVAVNTGGTWEASAIVERSYDNSTWETIRTISSSGISSGTITGTEIDPCFLRLKMTTQVSSPPTAGSFCLEAFDPNHYSIVTVTGYTSPTVLTVTINFEAASTAATKRWQEAAWSTYQGFPRSVSFHEGRLYFGGTTRSPQTVWGSIIDDYYNFRTGSDADLGLSFTLASDAANGIQWLVSQESLVIGTTGSEWALGSRASDLALSGETATVKRNTTYGSAHIQARAVNDTTLFIQRTARKVREFTYSFEKDGFAAQDLTLLAEHITSGQILQIAVQNNPETVLFAVTGDGILIGLTYERGQNVSGWFRYETEGTIESVAVVSVEGDEDEIWIAVKRTVDGSTVRYIERIQTGHANALKEDDFELLTFSDSSIITTLSPADTVVTGLDHLEGLEVAILADGSAQPRQTVTGGEITLNSESTNVVIGLPYDNALEPTYFETADPESVSKVANKRVTRVTAELWKSLGMEITADNGTTWSQVEFRNPDDYMDQSPPLFTGVLDESTEASSTRQASIIVRQTQPLPLNIMSLNIRYDLSLI